MESWKLVGLIRNGTNEQVIAEYNLHPERAEYALRESIKSVRPDLVRFFLSNLSEIKTFPAEIDDCPCTNCAELDVQDFAFRLPFENWGDTDKIKEILLLVKDIKKSKLIDLAHSFCYRDFNWGIKQLLDMKFSEEEIYAAFNEYNIFTYGSFSDPSITEEEFVDQISGFLSRETSKICRDWYKANPEKIVEIVRDALHSKSLFPLMNLWNFGYTYSSDDLLTTIQTGRSRYFSNSKEPEQTYQFLHSIGIIPTSLFIKTCIFENNVSTISIFKDFVKPGDDDTLDSDEDYGDMALILNK